MGSEVQLRSPRLATSRGEEAFKHFVLTDILHWSKQSRPIMPPIRGGSAIRPVKYERTHEENQERFVHFHAYDGKSSQADRSRAYIAASRRSDRGLEARMESARRASAIHKTRTGRALRITEADVINEAMYEEVNDLPTEYRCLNAHLQTQSAAFDRRLLAYLASQMGTRQALSDCWQDEQPQLSSQGVSTMMQQLPPHMSIFKYVPAGSVKNYRQTPYPTVLQSMHPGKHPSFASSATLHATGVDQQQLQSPHVSPHNSETQMIHPTTSTMQPPWPNPSMLTGSWIPSIPRRTDSAVDIASSPHYLHQPTPSHMADSQPYYQPWQPTNGNPAEPLSATLPMDSQQFFLQNPQPPSVNGPHHSTNSPPHNFSDRRYSYNPNGKPKRESASTSPSRFFAKMPLTTVQSAPHSSSPSPPRLAADPSSRPSTAYAGAGAFPQTCHDSSGLELDGSFTPNALQEPSNATSAETSPIGSPDG